MAFASNSDYRKQSHRLIQRHLSNIVEKYMVTSYFWLLGVGPIPIKQLPGFLGENEK
jgi:hypothetical protein